MSLAPDQIFLRVAAAITTGLTGWRQSGHAWDGFDRLRDGREVEHLVFQVGLPEGDWSHGPDRQRAAVGTLTATTVSVRWSHRLRAGGFNADYASALVAEATLVAALKGLSADPQLSVRFSRARRRVLDDELAFIGEVNMTIIHNYPLA